MGNGGGITHALYLQIALDWLNRHLAVQVPGFDSERMIGKLPEIETQTNNHRKLGVDTWEIPGNNGIEGSNDGELPGVFLRIIAKSKKFYLHI